MDNTEGAGIEPGQELDHEEKEKTPEDVENKDNNN